MGTARKAILSLIVSLAAISLAIVVPALTKPAEAASLRQVTGFGSNPTNLNMYVYVPDNVAPRPALLVLVHYCGGSAGAVFNGGGRDYVTAADRHGYVIVMPEATRDGRCFDVSTPAALTRDGGSDSTGIAAMVGYARQHYNVDPGRIVVSGFSSGAMMTNVLAAEYPDVFTAGASFSGVPAGCFATTNGSLWNSDCSGGRVSKTPQQWGDQARAMYPGYSGRYPRMQLWHGTTDTTLGYQNFGEAVKQWTNLHGLGQTPAFTDHPQGSWTRTRYGATSTQATVEGISVEGTGHTLPQAGMIGYAISFLGLDGSAPGTPAPSTQPAATPTTTPTFTTPTAAPTTTVRPTTPTGSPSSAAPVTSTARPTATTAPGTPTAPASSNPPPVNGTAGCRVTATVTAWNGGLVESVMITNTGRSAVSGWTLAFALPQGQSLLAGWSAAYTTTGTRVTAKSLTYNGSLAPGQSTAIGFVATHTGNAGHATGFVLNNAACTIA